MTDIEITDDKTLAELQAAFQAHFPFLKIEFYTVSHSLGEGSDEAEKLDLKMTIGKARKEQTTGHMSIHGNQKVSTLESVFQEVYGLNVQVFRKSGNLWLQTTTTDAWTLSEQNETAKEFALI